ncbi:MAG: PAS domain S-box protein [Deltaproteobacteria bacterium]|nr:PAS domain S-box protein [Deltaproteobacteria bacterium]
MADPLRTNEELREENYFLKKKNQELEHSESERKQMEEALRESEEKYRFIAEKTVDLITIVDMNLRFTYVSPSVFRLRGFNVEEAAKHTLDQVLTPESMQYALAVFAEEMAMEATGTADPDRIRILELEEYKKDGSLVWVEVTMSYLRDMNGKPIGILQVSRDITERKRIEESLRDSEARYTLIMNNITDRIWLTDMNFKVIWASESVMRDRGYHLEEINPFPFEKLLTPDSLETVIKTISEELTPQRLQQKDIDISKTLELEFFRKDGSAFWSEVKMRVLRYPDGTPSSILGVGRDITERKAMETLLRENQQKIRAIFDQSFQFIGLMTLDGTLVEVNKSALELVGHAEKDVLGKPFWKTPWWQHSPELQEKVRLAVHKAAGGETVLFEATHRAHDGTIHFVDFSLKPVTDERGSIQWLMPEGRDISQRKRAEDELRESEERYRSLVEKVNEGIFVAQDGIIKFINRTGVEISGYSAQEIISKPFLEIIHPDDRVMVRERYLRRLKGEGFESRYAFRFITKNGDIKWVELGAALINFEGRPATLNVLTDITERRQTEEEKRSLEERLQRAEKMEALGTLAGGVAHDLNNVLGVVVGYTELLLDRVDESNSIRPSLVKIMKGGERAAAIVQDLLTLARRGVPGKNVLNLNKIIADCQQLPEFENLSSYHASVRIKADLNPDLLNISGSSVHLGKTLLNLVSNAVEAMPNGGTVTIKTTNQYLDKPIQGYDEVREGDYVVLSVSDTGEGIPASDQKRVFEPFYTKKVMGRSGTGLGLAVVWGTVKDHHGYINVESEEGKGSTFTLYFPVTREEISAERIAVVISEYMGKGESILIVDDVKEQRDLATEMLRKLNYTITSVSSGEEAVAYLKEHQADLMVLDMIMYPGMDGLDTYKKVVEIHQKQKAIIVSGFSETDRVTATQALGAGAYVRKPYVIEKLGLAVRRELDRK